MQVLPTKYKKKNYKLKIQNGGAQNNKKPDICYPNDTVKKRLELLMTNTMNAFNNKNWDLLLEIYDDNIVAGVGDGMIIKNKKEYRDMMEMGNKITPDAKITSYETAFGCGDLTSVTGFLEGTFTGEIKNPDGTIIKPTGKHFINKNCVIAKWKDFKIIEEWSYWETDMMKSMGVKNI